MIDIQSTYCHSCLTPEDRIMETMNEGTHADNTLDETTGAVTATLAAKADLVKRGAAMIIDSVVASILGQIPLVGWIAGMGYILVRDGLDIELINRQSIGKKLLGLKAVRLDGEDMDIATSVRRNWMFALGALAGIVAWIPILGFLAVLGISLISFLIGVYEVYLVFTDTEGRRWGDTFGGTKVIEIDE